MTQLKAGAACDSISIDAEAPLSVSELIERVAAEQPALRPMLLGEDGRRHGWLMIAVDDAVVARGSDPPVRPGSTMVIGTPVSGG